MAIDFQGFLNPDAACHQLRRQITGIQSSKVTSFAGCMPGHWAKFNLFFVDL